MHKFKIIGILFLVLIFISGVSTFVARADSSLRVAIILDDSELEEVFVAELSPIEEIEVIDSQKTDAILAESEIEEVDEIQEAEQIEADFVITGILISLGYPRFRLELEAIDVEEGNTVYAESIMGRKEEIRESILEKVIMEIEKALLAFDLTGQVLDKQGRPVSGAKISFNQDYDSVFSDDEGQWKKEDLFKSAIISIEKEGWEFTLAEKDVDFKTAEVIFEGRELPYLEQIKVEFEEENLYEGQEYIVTAEGYDQYGNQFDIEADWQVWGGVAEIVSISYRRNRIALKTTAEGRGILELKADQVIEEVEFEVLSKSSYLEELILEPESKKLTLGEEASFEVKGFDQYGREVIIDPQWSLVEGPGELKKAEGTKVIYEAKELGSAQLEASIGELSSRAQIEIVPLISWSLDFGLNYNSYNLTTLNQAVEDRGGNSITSGMGFYLGVKRYLAQVDIIRERLPQLAPDMALGMEIERMSLNYDDLEVGEELNLSNTGFLLTASYKLIADVLELNLAAGQYVVNETQVISGGEKQARSYGRGFKSGLSFNLGNLSDRFQREFSDRFQIKGRGNYRFAKIGDYDFSGIELALLGEVTF